MTQPLEPWVLETAQWPLAFAQVREDPLLDLWVVDRIGGGARIIMVASGGCTAALLAASGLPAHIQLVDPNPAQLALARLKLHLLRNTDTPQRLALLGHRVMPIQERAARLAEVLTELQLPTDVMGPLDWLAEVGPDHAGRYERLFAELRQRLQPMRAELDAVLDMHDVPQQAARVAPNTPLGQALDRALDDVMALPNLIALFGERATRNRVEPFSRHFARRTRVALGPFAAATNPYLWQMYRGYFPESTPAPWFVRAPSPLTPRITWSNTVMTEALAKVREPVDFVHLSNILDWLLPDEARITLDLAAAALKPGGYVLIRQLNSTLDIPSLGSAFVWQEDQARILHAVDRSFFYRALHLGRKR